MFGSKSATNDRFLVDLSLLIVRVAAGLVFAGHGAQKMFGLFGGAGLNATIEQMQMGPVLGFLVSFGEFFGGVGLLVGLLTRFSAASLIVIMIGAIVLAHGKHGFFMQFGGYEYNLALIGLLAPTLLCGPGSLAIGRFLPFMKSKKTGRRILVLE